MNHTEKTMKMLRTGWTTSMSCAMRGGVWSLAQRVSEMRADGLVVSDKWVEMPSGARIKSYRIFDSRQKKQLTRRVEAV
jgi:hypothetical protein